MKEIKKYCSGIDCLTCDEVEPCIYRIANKLQEQLKRKEEECEKLKEELQAQRDFTAHEQKLIYCVAYDESCKTGNDCKQKKCIFKDNIKLKQTLAEIKEICNEYQKEYILNIGVEILTNKILQII